MATIIKGSISRGAGLLYRTDYEEGYYLEDVYGRCSAEKWRAYRNCKRAFDEDETATGFRITGHNCHQFTVAWECEVEYVDPKTGEVTMEKARHIRTACNTYIVLLDK